MGREENSPNEGGWKEGRGEGLVGHNIAKEGMREWELVVEGDEIPIPIDDRRLPYGMTALVWSVHVRLVMLARRVRSRLSSSGGKGDK